MESDGDEAHLNGLQDGENSFVALKLTKDIAEVIINGRVADVEDIRDVAAAFPNRRQLQNGFLPIRQAWVRGHYAHVDGVGAGKPAESLGFGRGRRSKRPQNLDTRLPQKALVNCRIHA